MCTYTYTHTHRGARPTCVPAASEATFPGAAVDGGGVAGVPGAQVTAETPQQLLLFALLLFLA